LDRSTAWVVARSSAAAASRLRAIFIATRGGVTFGSTARCKITAVLQEGLQQKARRLLMPAQDA